MSSEFDEITILILDDSSVDRQVYQRYLRSGLQCHIRVVEAETLEEGLEQWWETHPDLALVDINLPDGDGLEFLADIAPHYHDGKLPIIVLTGQGDERIAVQAMKLGAGDYLIKRDISSASLCICVAQVYERFLLSRSLARSQQQNLIISDISLHIHQFCDLNSVLKTLVHEVRCFLSADRVVVYKFSPDLSGKIIAESVLSPWSSSLDAHIIDTCFQDNGVNQYLQGKAIIFSDIATANLTDCHRDMLERFQVRASLIDPIFLVNETTQPLWGLLVVHQCSRPRVWENSDIHFVQQLAVQVALAIQQAELYRSQQLLNASLEREKEAAEAANRTQREWLTTMSHTMQVPMRDVLARSEQLLQMDLNETQRDQLEQIHRSAQSMLILTEEMQQLSDHCFTVEDTD